MTINKPYAPILGIIAYEGVQKSAVYGLADMFDMANRLVGDSSGPGIIHATLEPASMSESDAFDAILLPPNLSGAKGADDRNLHRWIRNRHRAGTIVCSACAGSFWLGHAGILDGRPATTHWALEADFRLAFPKVHLHPEHMLLDDNDIVTAGGVMAWVDLGVHLVGRWLGPVAVSRLCRQMLIDPSGREQRNYRTFRPHMSHNDQVIRELQLWMEGNVNANLSVMELARHAGLSARTLQRRFSSSTGLAVNQYVQELRIEKAKGLLEITDLSVNEVCWQVGYQDLSAFNRLFKSITGLSAGEYRRRFRIERARTGRNGL
jgi:transcriptional regulator GlxA family with amidase domain